MANLPSLPTSQFPSRNYVVIDGKKSPGRCTFRGAGTPRLWDKQKGPYLAGAYLLPRGDDLCDFEIDIDLWDRKTHPAAWREFATVLAVAPPGKPAKSVTIEHPWLVFPPLNIKACVIKDVGDLVQSETGLWTITIKCQAYRGPVQFVPKAADTPDVAGAQPKAKDAADTLIQEQGDQIQRLSSGADKSGLF